MLHLIDNFIYLIVYVGLISGTWLFISPFIFNRRRHRIRLSSRTRRINILSNKPLNENGWRQHIEKLLYTTLNRNSSFVYTTFIVLSIVLFSVSLLILYNLEQQLLINLMLSLFAGFTPYFLLRIRLYQIRVNSSYEAENLVTELISQYKMNYFNMMEAIDQTIPHLKKQPNTKKALIRLSYALKQYRSAKELDEIIREFIYSINTSWAMLLANNIFLSIEYGDNVKEALEDIVNDLIDLKNINEKNQQYNNETFVMIKYVAPGAYLFSIFSMFYIFNFTFKKFINYQFRNPIGFKFFILTITLIIFNYIVYSFIKKPKNDF